MSIPSLAVYILIEQATTAIALFRRTETGFVRKSTKSWMQYCRSPELGIVLPLAEVYHRVTFVPIARRRFRGVTIVRRSYVLIEG